jgi:hypothetical protein
MFEKSIDTEDENDMQKRENDLFALADKRDEAHA